MKRLLLSIFLCIFVQACSFNGHGHVIKDGEIIKKDDSIQGTYSYFNGTDVIEKNFSSNHIVHFSINSQTEKGDLEISIVDSKGKELLKTKNPKNVHKDIKFTEDNEYKIRINGKKHSGNFNITWKKDK